VSDGRAKTVVPTARGINGAGIPDARYRRPYHNAAIDGGLDQVDIEEIGNVAAELAEPFRPCRLRVVRERRPVRRARFGLFAGRRAGKDSIASVVAAHAAALFDGQDKLRPGERALVACLACDRDQAKIVLRYVQAYFCDRPLLRAMVRRETADGFELDNGVDVVVATNNYRAPRGRTLLCVIFDEVAYWLDERSARPDKETYRAITPGLATLPGMLIGISSPYAKSGLLFEKYSKHYGRDGDVLVIKAPTRALNPSIDPAIIDRAGQSTSTPTARSPTGSAAASRAWASSGWLAT
jgi:hypothetical protein